MILILHIHVLHFPVSKIGPPVLSLYIFHLLKNVGPRFSCPAFSINPQRDSQTVIQPPSPRIHKHSSVQIKKIIERDSYYSSHFHISSMTLRYIQDGAKWTGLFDSLNSPVYFVLPCIVDRRYGGMWDTLREGYVGDRAPVEKAFPSGNSEYYVGILN